jgi:hypothetical protein
MEAVAVVEVEVVAAEEAAVEVAAEVAEDHPRCDRGDQPGTGRCSR